MSNRNENTWINVIYVGMILAMLAIIGNLFVSGCATPRQPWQKTTKMSHNRYKK